MQQVVRLDAQQTESTSSDYSWPNNVQERLPTDFHGPGSTRCEIAVPGGVGFTSLPSSEVRAMRAQVPRAVARVAQFQWLEGLRWALSVKVDGSTERVSF